MLEFLLLLFQPLIQLGIVAIGGTIIMKIIFGLIDGDLFEYYGDSSSTSEITSSESTQYEHEDPYFIPTGSSSYKNGKSENYGLYGDFYGSSEKRGDRIIHKDLLGIEHGYSKISSDGKRIEHYDDYHLPQGYSEVEENGDIVHYDNYHIETGRSRKK